MEYQILHVYTDMYLSEPANGVWMVKTVQKGDRMELKAKKIMESRGFVVEKVRKSRFFKGDLFGCADLICINKDRIIFIAVTNKSNKSRSKKRLRQFSKHPCVICKEVWVYPGVWQGFDIEVVA